MLCCCFAVPSTFTHYLHIIITDLSYFLIAEHYRDLFRPFTLPLPTIYCHSSNIYNTPLPPTVPTLIVAILYDVLNILWVK